MTTTVAGPARLSGWTERVRRAAMPVLEAATAPLLPADYLDLFDPLRPGASLRGRIEAITRETPDAVTVTIKPGADWAGHTPGQYLRLGIDVNGVREWRAYSLTHGPRKDGRISITVKAVPDGKVSNFIVHEAEVGTLVHLEQPDGEFILPDDAHPKLLFVTAGSGITPVIGMLRNLFPSTDAGVLQPERTRHLDITVVHVAPSEPDSIFLRDLQALAGAGAINLIARYDDTDGVLDINQLGDLVSDLDERRTFACGPGGLLDALQAHHDERGLELFVEQFRTSHVEAGEGGIVTYADGTAVDVDGATTILDASEGAGKLMPSGCRMGICMGCKVFMTSGAVRDLRNGEITRAVPGETNTDGVPIQTCISSAAGPCEIDH